jgi:hypothetical protein
MKRAKELNENKVEQQMNQRRIKVEQQQNKSNNNNKIMHDITVT